MSVWTQTRMRRHKPRWRKPVEITENKRNAHVLIVQLSDETLLRQAFATLLNNTDLGKLELVMGKLVGYGLLKPALAGEMGYILGVCLCIIKMVSE